MPATVTPFPASRIVRRPPLANHPRMTKADLAALSARWPQGRHEVIVSDDDGTAFDAFEVPYPGADPDGDQFPMLLIALLPNGQWELHVDGDDRWPGPLYDTVRELIAAV